MTCILRKQDVQIFCFWNIIGDCCPSAMSAFDSWSDSHLGSPTHLHGTTIAEVIEPPGCVAWGRTCGMSSARRVAAARIWPDTPWEKGCRETSPPLVTRVRGIHWARWRAEFQWSQSLPSLGLGEIWEISFGNDSLRFKCLMELGKKFHIQVLLWIWHLELWRCKCSTPDNYTWHLGIVLRTS